MKSEIIRTLKIAALAISGAAILSCTNLDEVNERLDSLESRIQALETQLPTLNNNVTALTQIANSGIINGIKPTEEGDGYVITTVDGETYTLRQGSIGNTPLMSIDEDGYWIVSYDNGANYERITVGGQPVAAAGMTPKFQVGTEGQWQISYDGGKVFEDVKDTEGNTVTAVGEGSDFFQDLTYADGVLHITLADGQELDVTVVPDFSCVIAGVDYNTPEMFEYGATKHYSVNIKGVAEAIVSAPAGWTAVLEGTEPTAQLTVTAPEAETKISADTRTDVSILAVSSKGYSAITKMKVGLSAEPVPANPVASIQPVSDATTASSLSFTVTPNADATSWKYMLLKADAAAPATDADFADATEQTGTQTLNLTATADGTALAGNTEYAIYVLPINTKDGEMTYGAIASAKATTAMPSYDTYYAMYEAGLDITIAGRTYNKETYGEAELVAGAASINSNKDADGNPINIVWFVEPDATLTIDTDDADSKDKGIAKLIIIGNEPEQRSKLNLNSQIALNQGEGNTNGTFVTYNLDIDATQTGNYILAQNRDGAYGYVGIIDCSLAMPSGKPMSFITSNTRSFAEFVIEDSEIEIPSTKQLLFFSLGTSVAEYGTISFKNNIIYSEGGIADFRIINRSNDETGISLDNFIFENNTIINLWSTTNGCTRYKTLDNISVTRNIFWTDKTTANMCFFRPSDTSGSGPYTGNPTGTILDENIVYKNGETTNWQWLFGGMNRINKDGFSACNEITAVETNPLQKVDFSNAIFTPIAEYSSYGAQRD